MYSQRTATSHSRAIAHRSPEYPTNVPGSGIGNFLALLRNESVLHLYVQFHTSLRSPEPLDYCLQIRQSADCLIMSDASAPQNHSRAPAPCLFKRTVGIGEQRAPAGAFRFRASLHAFASEGRNISALWGMACECCTDDGLFCCNCFPFKINQIAADLAFRSTDWSTAKTPSSELAQKESGHEMAQSRGWGMGSGIGAKARGACAAARG